MRVDDLCPISIDLLAFPNMGEAPAWTSLGHASPELHVLVSQGASLEDAVAECRRVLESFWEYAETDRALGGL